MNIINNLRDWFNGRRRHAVHRFPLGWGGGSFLRISENKYAQIVVASLLDMVSNSLKGTVWTQQGTGSRDFACFSDFFVRHYDEVINCLFFDGRCPVVRDDMGFFSIDRKAESPAYVFLSTDYKRYGKSTAQMLHPLLDYLDDILNASQTSIRRLGVMAFLMPKTDTYGNGLTAEELDDEERRLQSDYGVLSDQKVVKLMSRDYSLGTLSIGGASLQLDSRLQVVVKMIAGKMGIPYELVAAAIVGNPNQTGVYQSEAVKRLYVTAAAYAEMFIDFAKSFGVSVDYDFPTAPKDYETAGEDLSAKIIANLTAAEQAGYLSHEEAVASYRKKVGDFDN